MEVVVKVDGTGTGRNFDLAFSRTAYIPAANQLTATVNWGDGSPATTYTSVTNSLRIPKTYAINGTYNVTVTGMNPGIGISMGDAWYQDYLTDVLSWSNIGSLDGGFTYCYNLVSVPNVLPVGVLSLRRAFRLCRKFNAPLNGWNTGYVTSMESTFDGATLFNQNIGMWNLSSCTTISQMFYQASAFNNGGSDAINGWNTANVTDMYAAFTEATTFNQRIDGWDVSKVVNMEYLFDNAHAFNNGGNGGIGAWNTGAVTSLRSTFKQARSFNQPIGSWNTANVTDMRETFLAITGSPMAFDQNISGWNVSSVGSNNALFVSSNPAYYQATWLASERPAGFPSFN